MRITCSCGKTITVNDSLVGKRIRCKECGEALLVEEDADDSAESRPRKRSEGSKSKRRKKGDAKNPPWLLIASGAGVLVIGAVVVIGSMSRPNPKVDAPQPQASVPAATPVDGASTSAPVATPAAPSTAKPAAPPAKTIDQLKGHNRLAVSRDRKLLATFSDRFDSQQKKSIFELNIWDLTTGKEVTSRDTGYRSSVLQFSPTGKYIASSGTVIRSVDGKNQPLDETKIWDLSEAGDPIVLDVGGSEVEFSTDETTVYIFRANKGLYVVDLAQRTILAQLAKDSTTGAICPSKNVAIIELTSSGPASFVFFDLKTYAQDKSLYTTPRNETAYFSHMAQDGCTLACTTFRGKYNLLGVTRLGRGESWKELELSPGDPGIQIRISDDGKLVAAKHNGKLVVWEWEAGSQKSLIPTGVTEIEFAPMSHDLYVITGDPGVQLVNGDTGEVRPISPSAGQ